MLRGLMGERSINRSLTAMNQTQAKPRRSWEGGWQGSGGAMCINSWGQCGQWCLPMPAESRKSRGLLPSAVGMASRRW